MKFFFGGATGLKHDIKRHMDQEASIREKIAELEKEPETKMNKSALRVYRNFLAQLLTSKAQVTSQIGLKK